MANFVAQRAKERPSEFSALARKYSDDTPTRDSGGTFGGIDAARIELDASELLDCLAVLENGEISDVVESRHGFHVVRRDAAPEKETEVSGIRLVIAYDNAQWLHRFLARRQPPSRSRAQALRFASELLAQAQQGAISFEDLVRQQSEHRDAEFGGDLGNWSTHESSGFYRELHALQQLDVGGISAPIDTFMGIQILKRTPSRPRKTYAMTAVRLAFDPSLESGETSRDGSFARISKLSGIVAEHPKRFEELQREYCCKTEESWEEGRGSEILTRTLAGLPIGGIASEPILVDHEYLIPKRIKPPEPSRDVTRPVFPMPHVPDVEYLVRLLEKSTILSEVGLALGNAQHEDGVALASVVTTLQKLPENLAALEPHERRGEIRARLEELKEPLGPERYREFADLLNVHVDRRLAEAIARAESGTL